MKTPHHYLSGPHAGDYYLLLDEQSDCIFATRLAEHIREASGTCAESARPATASLLEMWIDDANNVWYLFEAAPPCRASTEEERAGRRQPLLD